MKPHHFILSCVALLSLQSCLPGPDPCEPDFMYYILNKSNDSVVCHYRTFYMTAENINEVRIGSSEQKILHLDELNDTIGGSIYPKAIFRDMLFTTTNGDTLLYINPIVDSDWIRYNYIRKNEWTSKCYGANVVYVYR